MNALTIISFWSSLVLAGAATLLYWKEFALPRLGLAPKVLAVGGTGRSAAALWFESGPVLRPGSSLARGASALVVGLLGATLMGRAVAAGRVPLSDLWEFTVAFAFATALAQALLGRRQSMAVGALLAPVVLVLLLLAAALPSQVRPVAPILRNPDILAAHVGVMVAAYGVLSLSFAAALAQLIQGSRLRIDALPDPATLDALAYRSVAIGFPLLALGIALGAYWAASAWGSYWSWDPKETSALVTWLAYGVYFHLHSLRSWAGSRSAVLLIVAYGCLAFSFLAVNLWVSGLHSYAGA